MRQSLWGWRALAISASVLLHALLLIHWADLRMTAAKTEPKKQPTRLTLSFQQPPQPVVPPQEPEPEPLPEPAPEPLPEPKPEPVPEPKPEPKPKPTPKPKPQPKPEPKPEPIPDPPPAPVPPKAEPLPVAPEAPPEPVDQSPLIQERYLAEILERVKSNRFYPSLARRKEIEGSVTISFTLLEGGQIQDLQVEDGHKLLRQAAGEAVRNSAPFPAPPDVVSLPLPVRFSMEFKLQ